MKKYIKFLIPFLLLAGCKKDGVLNAINDYNLLTVKIDYAVDPDVVYRIELQGEFFADSLTYGSDDSKRLISEKKYVVRQEKRHFVLYDKTHNKKVIDTLLTLKVKDIITLVQLRPGAPPTIISSADGGGEPEPEAGKTKVRFTYNDPSLPDSVLLKIYSVANAYSAWDYSVDPPVHQFVDFMELKVYKNDFSKYLELDFKKYSPTDPAQYVVEVYDLKTGTAIQKVEMYDYWFFPGFLNYIAQANNANMPLYKFFNLRLISRVTGGLSTGDITEYTDEFLYGVPW